MAFCTIEFPYNEMKQMNMKKKCRFIATGFKKHSFENPQQRKIERGKLNRL